MDELYNTLLSSKCIFCPHVTQVIFTTYPLNASLMPQNPSFLLLSVRNPSASSGNPSGSTLVVFKCVIKLNKLDFSNGVLQSHKSLVP